MFCPNAADLGNVADWVSGIGALIGVLAALWIAGTQQRSVKQQRNVEYALAFERRAQIIAEAIRLSGQIKSIAQRGIQGENTPSTVKDVVDQIDGIRSQIDALQGFPMDDPRLFAELGRISHESKTEPGLVTMPIPYTAMVMRRMASSMAERRQAVLSIPERQLVT